MKIDAHHHLWDLQAVNYPWLMAEGEPRFFGDPSSIQRNYLLEEHRQNAEPHQIAASVHIQVGAADPLAEAEWVQSVADSQPLWPIVQVAFADLSAAHVQTHIESLIALPSMRGVRQILGRAPGEDAATGTQSLIHNKSFERGLHAAAEAGLRFDLQLIPALIPAAAALLRKVPKLQVALCHAGSPHDRSAAGLAAWGNQIQLLAALPQVHCKLSGLGMFDHNWSADSVRPIVETCLSAFGAERCMWGSNFPVDSLSATYAQTHQRLLELVPEPQHADVFGATAARFYDVTG